MAQKLTPELIKRRMAGERVSLVGGAGFIGHNLALSLRQYGVEVQIVDNLMQNNMLANVSDTEIDDFRRQLNHNFLVQRFEKMRNAGVVMDNADARSMTDLAETLKRFQPTKVVHLSAISSAVDARKVPGHCFDLQLVTLRNVLEYTRLFPNEINEVVFMSSSTVYGDFETETVDENVRPRPYGIYANAKFMGERLIRTYHEQYGLGISIIRPSALYGERCISRRVSQAFIENALMGKPLRRRRRRRQAPGIRRSSTPRVIRSMAATAGAGSSNTFNITFGNARTILDLANIVKSVVPNAILEERPRDVIKPIRGTLSTARAKEHLNFIPQWPLEVGYKRYCEWYVDQWERTRHRMEYN